MVMKKDFGEKFSAFRARLFNMVSVGVVDDPINQGYDIVSTLMLICNLTGAVLATFDSIDACCGTLLDWVERITVAFFALDYIFRLITAKNHFPELTEGMALKKYVLSASGIIDLLSFLPYYLPVFFPSGAAAFRLFRVARIFRLFRINAYYDSLNVITEVIAGKKQQLFSSVFIILVLMLGSSLCMYSLEHDAQPEVFKNAFSGIWWSVSTLLTVGYGDIYPITPGGKAMSIIITFLGVGMVAIPTGIISAGFVEQYTRLKRLGDYAEEEDLHFIKTTLRKGDLWVNKTVRDLHLPQDMILAVIQRGNDTIIPRGDVMLRAGDTLILGAEHMKGEKPMNLREITLRKNHDWNGVAIKDLDISRQSFIVMVRRNKKLIVPYGSLILTEGDTVILYSKDHVKPKVTF